MTGLKILVAVMSLTLLIGLSVLTVLIFHRLGTSKQESSDNVFRWTVPAEMTVTHMTYVEDKLCLLVKTGKQTSAEKTSDIICFDPLDRTLSPFIPPLQD